MKRDEIPRLCSSFPTCTFPPSSSNYCTIPRPLTVSPGSKKSKADSSPLLLCRTALPPRQSSAQRVAAFPRTLSLHGPSAVARSSRCTSFHRDLRQEQPCESSGIYERRKNVRARKLNLFSSPFVLISFPSGNDALRDPRQEGEGTWETCWSHWLHEHVGSEPRYRDRIRYDVRRAFSLSRREEFEADWRSSRLL